MLQYEHSKANIYTYIFQDESKQFLNKLLEFSVSSEERCVYVLGWPLSCHVPHTGGMCRLQCFISGEQRHPGYKGAPSTCLRLPLSLHLQRTGSTFQCFLCCPLRMELQVSPTVPLLSPIGRVLCLFRAGTSGLLQQCPRKVAPVLVLRWCSLLPETKEHSLCFRVPCFFSTLPLGDGEAEVHRTLKWAKPGGQNLEPSKCVWVLGLTLRTAPHPKASADRAH